MLPDTHAHLDAPVFTAQHGEIVCRALAAGVDRILTVGTDLESSRAAVALAGKFESVFAAVGIHPHEAGRFEREAEGVRSLLGETKVVAVGEVGLDYYRGHADRGEQLQAFREQLRWAQERALPVSVHNRDAGEDVLRELKESGARAVLHCFSGRREMALEAMDEGYYISFAGPLTYRRSDELRSIASDLPGASLLVETDAPVLAPQPWRGKRNEPAYVVAVADMLAAARDITRVELDALVTANADRAFGWRAS